MTNNTKKPTARVKRSVAGTTPKKAAEQIVTASKEGGFDRRKLLAIPLAFLATYCIYTTFLSLSSFSQIFQVPLYEILMFPPFATIFVGTFSCLAIYILLKGKAIGGLATAVAWILVAISAWLGFSWLAYTFPGNGPKACTGLFGVRDSCADVSYLQVYVLLLNPFSLALYSLLAIAGIATMTRRLKK